MSKPTEDEIKESIQQLNEYKNRLEKEILIISQKLKISPNKIKSIIHSHKELNQIKKILLQLRIQQDDLISNLK